MTKSKISIIIPTYNYGKYIRQTIKSVCSQSYEKLDIVIIDDGSIDYTKEIILKNKDPRIRYFYQDNRGANAARNNGIKKSKGDFLLFLDSDDLLEPTHIEEYLKVALRNPGANVYGPWAKGWYENNEFKVDFSKGKCPEDDLLTCWIGNWWIASNCILWPRGNIEQVGEWDETLQANQDGDIAMRALIAGIPFIYAENAPVAKITTHNHEIKSISGNISQKTLTSRYRVLDKIENLLINNDGLHPDRKKALAKKYYYLACKAKLDFPEISDKFYYKYRKLYGLRKPPGKSILTWLLILVFGWRYEYKILPVAKILKHLTGERK